MFIPKAKQNFFGRFSLWTRLNQNMSELSTVKTTLLLKAFYLPFNKAYKRKMLACFFWMSRNLNIWNEKNRNPFAKATRELCMTRPVVNTNSYPYWRVCCLPFTFWLWLLQNCRQRFKTWQIMADTNLICKCWRVFPASTNCPWVSEDENLVARQDNLVDDFVIFCRHVSLLFPFYNTFYKPDIDLRSLNFQYLKVKQKLNCL